MTIRRVVFSRTLTLAGLLLAARTGSAQLVGNPTNPFPGTNAAVGGGAPTLTLTWGANDGAACTVIGAPTDNGESADLIEGRTCVAAKLDIFANGWAQLSIWNRAGQEGTDGTARIRGFGLFWCQGSGIYACDTGFTPSAPGATPKQYNDGIDDANHGNWYTENATNTAQVDWRVVDPLGNPMVNLSGTNPFVLGNISTNAENLKGDGVSNNNFDVTAAMTPFTSLNGGGAYLWQFFFGTGADYDFTNQWMVLDVVFENVQKPAPNSAEFFDHAAWSCVDDRYSGTPTAGTNNDVLHPNNEGCGSLAAAVVTPEPATFALMATSLAALSLVGLLRRRRKA